MVVAIGLAVYTGFRAPSAWTATLHSVSVTDGFRRRVLVGTLLRPLALATDYDYWVFAGWSFLVSAAVLGVVVGVYLRTGSASVRLLIVGWLLLPTGGYFFHEVGYYDHVLYLLLFAALWLLHRNRVVLAVAVMTLSVLAHEITVLTVLPIFAMVALWRLAFWRALAALAPPALVTGAVLLAVAPAAPGATGRLAATVAQADFPYRPDALALFNRTQSQSWQLYSVSKVLLYLAPFLTIAVVAFLVLRLVGDALTVNVSRPPLALVHGVIAAAAITMPATLAFAGWDKDRWGFLLVTNLVVVLVLHLRHTGRELTPPQVAVLVAAMLLITHLPLSYFDGYAPRPLHWTAIRQFLSEVVHGHVFVIPTR
ncbi:hypothetical protein GCM10010171_21620 [Actinokineospora fastidiosa]|uniref:Uncharacterized protein n=1 Tax=Actinokineospora fastidiosa TaxID=1816 RepID=A0A918GB73_9PSEU|nr:hypothetical protein GCM10010171_21620 [Actinokineospora fastidiosa]